jgi:PadR family transcriptional regulator PadR
MSLVGAGTGRTSQLLRGVLDVCLLAVIAEAPAYGYEMTARLVERGLDVVSEGSIYPAVARLERQGLIESFRVDGNGGPPRKYYRPTRAGRHALVGWRAEWVETRDSVDSVLGTGEVG